MERERTKETSRCKGLSSTEPISYTSPNPFRTYATTSQYRILYVKRHRKKKKEE